MLSSFIALRYLFSKKSHNAINIVSGVSAAAVGVVTAAMVCVLSVMNGFGKVVRDMFSEFDPELRITAAEGKYFATDTEAFQSLRDLPFVAVYSESVEDEALVEFEGRQLPVRLKGVDSLYQSLVHIDSILLDGHFQVWDGGFERCVLGVGLANQMNIGAHFIKGLHLYAPRRNVKVNLLRPDESFNEATCWIAGIFAVNQTKYDDHFMLVSLPLARAMLDYSDTQVTAVELRLSPDANLKAAKRDIRRLLGDRFLVQDRYEQQADFYRILKIEKLMTALLLIFILIIAAFNIIGSLTMLMLDKAEDTQILRHLGASSQQVHRIFLLEGWLISSLGAGIGLFIGLIVCLLQEHFGFIKLGNGTEYVLSAYPVEVVGTDILLVAVVVLVVGWAAAYIPTRHLKHE